MWAPVSKDATGEGEATDAASKVAGMNFGDVDQIGIGSTSPKFKQYLALQHPDSIQAYMDGKDAFVKQREALASHGAVRNGTEHGAILPCSAHTAHGRKCDFPVMVMFQNNVYTTA
jgi:hypothetical protein